jgi:hypothetical protein
MKKLLSLTLAGLALALPATALADTCVLMHLGGAPSSHVAKGSCVIRKLTSVGALVLRCDGSTGYAVARYDFTMPGRWSGTACPHVDAAGDPTVSLVKLDDNHVRVIVRTTGVSKVVVRAVSVGFYT